MLPKPVIDWIVDNGFGDVLSTQLIGGGCISNSSSLITSTGNKFFLKTNQNNPADMFIQEAEGLKALCLPFGPRVPVPYTVGSEFILLEHLNPGRPTAGYWETLGTQLACLHNITREQFGFEHNNYIGRIHQINTWQNNGHEFFGNQRLLYQARRANKNGLLDGNAFQHVERLIMHLDNLVPFQPA
ncbi:fructosamine kinase family protein, partial [Chloroflexota bacterium]